MDLRPELQRSRKEQGKNTLCGVERLIGELCEKIILEVSNKNRIHILYTTDL